MADFFAFGSGGLQEAVRQIFSKLKPKIDTSPLFPNYDNLAPVATYTYNIASTSYYRICRRANTGLADAADFDDLLLFRITVTGSGIYQVADVFVQGSRAIYLPVSYAINRTVSSTSATTGIRYLRFNYPNELNSGYGWDIEIAAYNATARTVKVEVFATTDNVTWASSLTPTEYDSTNWSTASMSLYSNRGLCALGTVPITASSATTAGYITSCLPLFVSGTQPLAGEALPANSLMLFSANKAYKASNKTVAITPEMGLAFCSNATKSGAALTYYYTRQKASWTTLTGDSAMTKATIARGNPVYLRCTLSNGNIYSDAYLSPTMTAGYTWCYIGTAQSASAINVDCTHPLYLTLDTSGKLTHVNGREIGGGGGVTSVNNQTGAVTITAAGIGAVPTSSYDPVTKTAAMTQAVGKDSLGRLWTAPGSSGNDDVIILRRSEETPESIFGACASAEGLSKAVLLIDDIGEDWPGAVYKRDYCDYEPDIVSFSCLIYNSGAPKILSYKYSCSSPGNPDEIIEEYYEADLLTN